MYMYLYNFHGRVNKVVQLYKLNFLKMSYIEKLYIYQINIYIYIYTQSLRQTEGKKVLAVTLTTENKMAV